MSECIIHVPLPAAVFDEVVLQAERSGLTPEQWMLAAARQRLSTHSDVEEFKARKAAGATGKTTAAILARVPNGPPVEGDALPDELKERYGNLSQEAG